MASEGLAVVAAFAGVFAFGFGRAGEEGEQGGAVPAGVVDALKGAGEEFEADVVVA